MNIAELTVIAYHKTGSRQTAEELVQETFLSLYQHKSSIGEGTSVRAFLYVILKNKIIDFYRHKVVKQEYEQYLSNHTLVASDSPASYVETRELEKLLKEAIDKLPPKCREVFKLSREQGMADKAIAAHMEISVNTVEQHKSKALRLLRVSLGNLFETVVLIYFFGK